MFSGMQDDVEGMPFHRILRESFRIHKRIPSFSCLTSVPYTVWEGQKAAVCPAAPECRRLGLRACPGGMSSAQLHGSSRLQGGSVFKQVEGSLPGQLVTDW